MEWHSSLIENRASFAPPCADPTSFNFLFNSNLLPTFPPPPGMDLKQMEMMMGGVNGGEEKKKRLTCEQLESLERSFQEEIKLDPERKMRLSRELSLHPRQVAVWFQNRRARWKAKQLERLYDSLRLQFEAVTREKQRLQQEVMKLRAMLMEQGNMKPKQVSVGFTEVSGGDETVESTSAAAVHGGSAGSDGERAVVGAMAAQLQPQQHSECPNYAMLSGMMEDYNTSTTSPYWAAAYPPC